MVTNKLLYVQCYSMSFKNHPGDDVYQYRQGCFEEDSSPLNCRIIDLADRVGVTIRCCQGHMCNEGRQLDLSKGNGLCP